MQKMRAGLVVTLVAGLLLMGSGRAGAVIGIPDDVPGATLLYPFFKVDPTPAADSRQDTLIVVTNTANLALTVHVTVWNVRSEHIFDFSVPLTQHDVFSCSLLDLIVNPENQTRPCGTLQAPASVATSLTQDDILAGYITVDAVTAATSTFPGESGYPFLNWNVLVGHLYLVDLPAGSASGFNAVSIEALSNFGTGTGAGQTANAVVPEQQVGFYLTQCITEQAGGTSTCAPVGTYGNRERIDGPAGDIAQTGDAEQPVVTEDSPLSLIVRYFSVEVLDGRTEIWLWKDRNTSGSSGSIDLAVYDEDENAISVSFQLPDEVNFTETESVITPGAPGGWFRLRFSCGTFGSCGYDPFVGSSSLAATPIQAVAYGLQFAMSDDETLRWDATFPAHRQYTNYIGGPGSE